MATVHVDVVAVRRNAQRVTTPVVKQVVNESVRLSKRWPRAGNPAWTDSSGKLYRNTKGSVVAGPNPTGMIVNDLPYALAVNNGTDPRIIYAKGKGRMKFRWKRFDYRLVYFRFVKHPRTKGSGFLTQPFQTIAKRHGFKVTTTLTR